MADSQVQPSEREAYIQNLEDKLRKAGRARRFLDDENGSLVTDYLTEQINIILKRIGGKTYMSDQQGYVYELGALHLAQKILNMLNSEATINTDALKEKIKEAKSEA